MSNKKKKNRLWKISQKPKKTDTRGLQQDKQESISLRELARDERTWKIIGAVSLLNFPVFWPPSSHIFFHLEP